MTAEGKVEAAGGANSPPASTGSSAATDSPAPSGFHKLLLEQRDKQLDQFMKVNGQATFSVLTATFVVMFGADDVAGVLSGFSECKRTVLIALLVLGMLLIAAGALGLSVFHTTRIRALQRQCEAEIKGLPGGSLQLIPPQSFTFMPIFMGLALIAGFAIFVMVASMVREKADKQSAVLAVPAALEAAAQKAAASKAGSWSYRELDSGQWVTMQVFSTNDTAGNTSP